MKLAFCLLPEVCLLPEAAAAAADDGTDDNGDELDSDGDVVAKRQRTAVQSFAGRNRDHHKLNYYVCTLTGCEWNGARPTLHTKRRPQCRAAPCKMAYEKATGPTRAVAEFRARLTPRQRELGLAPDYEQPVPMADASGYVDLDVLYLTVPHGRRGGDVFELPIGNGKRCVVMVPTEKKAGDLMSVDVRSAQLTSTVSTVGGLAIDARRTQDEDAGPAVDRPSLEAMQQLHVQVAEPQPGDLLVEPESA